MSVADGAVAKRHACRTGHPTSQHPAPPKSPKPCVAPVWWLERRAQNPIPSRTRPLNTPAPMVLCLKARESRSPPDLHNASAKKPFPLTNRSAAGWSSPVARQAHNLKVVGSNPTPATSTSNHPPRRKTRAGCSCAPRTRRAPPCTRQRARPFGNPTPATLSPPACPSTPGTPTAPSRTGPSMTDARGW